MSQQTTPTQQAQGDRKRNCRKRQVIEKKIEMEKIKVVKSNQSKVIINNERNE